MFLSDSAVYSLSLLDCGFMLFLLIYFVITLTDLECDYLNSIDCCSKLNSWTLPKIIAQLITNTLLLLHAKWWLSIVNAVISFWFILQWIRVPKANFGIYDPTEIQNRDQLKGHMRHIVIQIGLYLLLFFVYLFSLLVSLVENTVVLKDDDTILSTSPVNLN